MGQDFDFDATLIGSRDNVAIQAVLREMKDGKGDSTRIVGDFIVIQRGWNAMIFKARHLYSVQLDTVG